MSDEASQVYGLPWHQPSGGGEEWRAEGLCRGIGHRDPSLADCFFSDSVAAQRRAKALCAQCPSQAPCLEYGLHEPTGVWGGAGVRERQRLVASLRQAKVSVRPAPRGRT